MAEPLKNELLFGFKIRRLWSKVKIFELILLLYVFISKKPLTTFRGTKMDLDVYILKPDLEKTLWKSQIRISDFLITGFGFDQNTPMGGLDYSCMQNLHCKCGME